MKAFYLQFSMHYNNVSLWLAFAHNIIRVIQFFVVLYLQLAKGERKKCILCTKIACIRKFKLMANCIVYIVLFYMYVRKTEKKNGKHFIYIFMVLFFKWPIYKILIDKCSFFMTIPWLNFIFFFRWSSASLSLTFFWSLLLHLHHFKWLFTLLVVNQPDVFDKMAFFFYFRWICEHQRWIGW